MTPRERSSQCSTVVTRWPRFSGAYFDDETSAELPSWDLFRVDDGTDFGGPYCYYDHFQDERILASEYGGAGESEG